MKPSRLTRRRALALAGTGLTALSGCADAIANEFVTNTASACNPRTENGTCGEPQFVERATAFGFEYEHVSEGNHQSMTSLVSTAGVYVSDFDNDGRKDLLAIGGESPMLFQNTGEGFRQSDALPDVDGQISGALFLDYDNDGWDELLLLRMEGTPVFLDNDEGTFTVREVGFDRSFQNPVGAAAADFNRDGCLDVFIIQNGNWDGNRPRRMIAGSAPEEDNGNPNVLYRGDCSTFTEVTDAGIDDNRWTLATAFVDLTGDGYPDIYVSNDYNYDVLYVNDGNGNFEHHDVDYSNRNAMSAAVADVSGNGRLDVFVTNIYYHQEVKDALDFLPARPEGNNLFVNREGKTLTDEASTYEVQKGGWGWAATISDFTNDGTPSIFHTTSPLGAANQIHMNTGRSMESIYRDYPYLAYPMFFDREDSEFTSRHPPELGFEKGNGRGVVAFDATGNGALDLAISEIDQPYKLYENTAQTGNWVQVDVEPAATMTAIGTEVTVTSGGSDQYQVVTSNADFLSQEPRTRHFGVGTSDAVDLSVVYPDGTTFEFADVAVNQRVTITPDGTLEASS